MIPVGIFCWSVHISRNTKRYFVAILDCSSLLERLFSGSAFCLAFVLLMFSHVPEPVIQASNCCDETQHPDPTLDLSKSLGHVFVRGWPASAHPVMRPGT